MKLGITKTSWRLGLLALSLASLLGFGIIFFGFFFFYLPHTLFWFLDTDTGIPRFSEGKHPR